MPLKRQLTHLKKARKLAKLRKIGDKSETLIEDTSFLLKDESTEGSWLPGNNTSCHKDFDWEEDSNSEDDVEMTDDDEDVLDINAFTKLLRAAQDSSNFESHKTPFLRGFHLPIRQKRRHAQYQRKLASSAHGCQPLIAGFLITNVPIPVNLSTSTSSFPPPSPVFPPTNDQSHPSLVKDICPKAKLYQEYLNAIHDLEKKISSKTTNLQGQDLTCHRAVLSFLKIQIRNPDHTRKKTTRRVAECYGRGFYVSKKIVTWEIQWMTKRCIEEGKQGCHTKSHSWFNDEGVQLAVCECISSSGDKLSAQKLAKALGDHLGSQTVTNTF